MFTEKLYLDHLPPALLDHYLAKGWYRMGQSMFTCRFLMFQGQLFPAIWVRLPLSEYVYSKRLRKLVNRNANQFQVVIRPGKVNMEKERLYQKYRKNFSGRLAPSLKISLLDDGNINLFKTYETCIYEGTELVGFSFFDLGKDSLASIMGVYHPDYKKHSLGFFTMLLEIKFGLENGYSHYYPGYIVPGYSKFDYKTRIGQVEYFEEKSQKWVPKSQFPFDNLPTEQMEKALKEVKAYLDEANFPNHIVLYPPYEANLIGYWILDYLEFPMLLECTPPDSSTPARTVLAYDTIRASFLLYQCSVYDDLSDFFLGTLLDSSTATALQLELLIKDELIAEALSAKEMARIITTLGTEGIDI